MSDTSVRAAVCRLTAIDELIPVEQLVDLYIMRALALFGGNVCRAAKHLGLDRRTIYRRMRKSGLELRPGQAGRPRNGARSEEKSL